MRSTYHMYVENSRSGIMKRSGMDVNVISDVQTLPVYSVSSVLYSILTVSRCHKRVCNIYLYISCAVRTDNLYLCASVCAKSKSY